MAVSIIAAILGQRNWEFVFSRLANRKAPPNWFQTTDAGRPPESLWAVIEMALETISAESSEALRAAAFWAPGEVFPLFYLEADDELSTQVDLETALEGLTQAALIETLFWTGQNGFMAHFLRLHRLISLFIYGSTQTAFMRHLNSKALSVLLNQIFLAQNIHIPCQFFLQAFQGRHMAFRHLNDLVNRYKTTPGDFDHQELMLYSMALEAGRLAHSLAGPTEAVTTMERILGRTNSNAYLHNPDVFIQWVEYRLAAGNTARLDERLQDFLSEYGKDLFSVIRAQACQVRLAAVIGDRRQVQSLLQKLERSADRYSLAFSCPPVCRELIFAHVRASLVINQEQVTDEIMQHYIEAIQALGGEILGEPEKTIFMTYPALTTGLETTWELAEALLASDLGELAFWLQREVTRLAIALPWIYALDHFYRYARLAWQIGFFDVAQSLLDYLRQGERACQVDSCRSKILTARFDPDQTSGNQQLEELARSFNKRGQLAWRDEAQKIGTLSLNGTLVSRQRSKGGFSKPFTFYPLHILAKVQNHLHLPDFADDTAPLPRELPW